MSLFTHLRKGVSKFITAAPALALPSLALAGLLAAGGCQDKQHDENVALFKQNRELQAQNSALQANRTQAPDPSLSAELAARDARIRDLEKNLNDTRPAQPDTTVTPSAPLPKVGQGVEVRQDKTLGTITMDLPGDVLFDSGRATLNESSKATLNKVAAVIKKDYSGKVIRVDGHTDSDPIVHSQWKSNKDLSVARAKAVTQYLESQGVPASHLQTQGLGDTHPRGSDKRANRRVEVIVMTRENVASSH